MSILESYIGGIEACTCGKLNNVCNCGLTWKLDLLGEIATTQMWEMSHGIAGSTEPIVEHIPTALSGANYTRLKTKLDRFQRQAWKWRDNVMQNNSIWLHEQFASEAGLRRSYVHQIAPIRTPRRGSSYGEHQLQVTRHWCSESCEPIEIEVPAEPHWGRVFDPGYAIGTTDGRICEMEFGALGSGALYNTVWVGIKEDVGCGIDQWNPRIENFANGLAQAGTATMTEFNRVQLRDVTTAPEQYRGCYYVLACVAAEAGATVALRGTVGWEWDEYMQPITHSPIFFEGKGLGIRDVVSLGVACLPIDDMRYCTTANSFDTMQAVSLAVEFKTDPVGAAVAIEELYLIPYEHSAVLRRPDRTYANADLNGNFTSRLYLHTHEDDTVQTAVRATPIIINPNDQRIFRGSAYDPGHNRFYMPEKGSRIVSAVQLLGIPQGAPIDEPVTYLNKDLPWQGHFTVYPRWLSDRDA